MDYRLIVARPWRYRDRKRGAQQILPGTYAVPEQVSTGLAELAIAQGVGRRQELPKPAPTVKADPPSSRRRKTPSPRNKMRAAAPDNKAVLV